MRYTAEDLRFAYAYHIYLCFKTHQAKPQPALAGMTNDEANGICSQYGIHLLEFDSSQTTVKLLVSLKPEEAVAACAGKLKGQFSKHLRRAAGIEEPTHMLSRGYFACTTGKSSAQALEGYLSSQERHHGYADRPQPPVYEQTYHLSAQQRAQLAPKHAFATLDFHIVLATCQRRCVFHTTDAKAVAERWVEGAGEHQFALRKVSFVPDHVHVAVRLHPQVAPATAAAVLMSLGQKALEERTPRAFLGGRLWQLSAYIGSFGSLATPQLHQYIRNWPAGTPA